MNVDFTPADRTLLTSAATVVHKALERAASAARSVGHADTPFTADLAHLEHFNARYMDATQAKDSEAVPALNEAVRLNVPEAECVVMRQGILLLLDRHQGTEATLQKELALTDNGLVSRLGDLRDLGMRFGGQPTLFDPATAEEKGAMAAEVGLPAAAVGAAKPKRRIAHQKAKDDGRGAGYTKGKGKK